MRQALEGGPGGTSNTFPVTTQGHVVMSGHRERSFPSLSTLCGHPRHCSATQGTVVTSPMLLECTGTGRRHDRHCIAYGRPVDGSLEPARGGGRTTNHYAATLEAAPVRAQDAPRRPDWSRIRQDGRQLHGTARHTSTRRKIVWHTCKLLPPWPIKGGEVPQPQGTRDDGQRSPTRSPPSPRYWHLPQSIPMGLGDLSSSPTTLVAPFLRAPRCEAI
jgi:hypothetical protein